jgi:SAM-dependent methyltransferase
MSIGRLGRRALGPLEQGVSHRYRTFFVNTDHLAQTLVDCAKNNQSHLRILEIGCGEGLVASSIINQFASAQLLGIDITPDPGRFFTGDLQRAQFRSCSTKELVEEQVAPFDLVILCDVLHHVPDDLLQSVLHDAVRLLAPDGLLAVKEMERDNSIGYWLGWFSDRVISGEQVRFFDRSELRALLDDVCPGAQVVAERRVEPRRCNSLMVWQLSEPAAPAADAEFVPEMDG